MSQVPEDYYAVLGVAPRSEASEIRAAYLALMRRYHPDKNDSPEAIERAHAIIAAFAVLGDVEKRLSYDWARRRAAEAAAQPPRWQFGRSLLDRVPRALIGVVLVLLLLVPLSFIRFPVTVDDPPSRSAASGAVAASDPIEMAEAAAVASPLAARAPVAAPPPIAVAEPAPVEPAAAQPRLTVKEVALVRAPPPRELPPRERQLARSAVSPDKALTSASAKCRSARPGAEAAICNNDNLAALDRTVVTFYNQSLKFGAATKRGALLDSRGGFLARREACRSDDCLRGLHLAHLREISAIVESQPPEPPR